MLLLSFASASVAAEANPRRAPTLLYPTHVDPTSPPALEGVRSAQSAEAAALAQRLDQVLNDAILDLGLGPIERVQPPAPLPVDLERQASLSPMNRWRVIPSLARAMDGWYLRITVVPSGRNVGLVKSLRVEPERLEVVAMAMARDLVRASAPALPQGPIGEPQEPIAPEPRSNGRAALALNAAALGGYVGFALQRAGGSNDARLTYPLLALGTGAGLGASMIVAEEWDVSVADAWYLSAGILWPTASALFIIDGFDDTPSQNRYVNALVGTGAGLSLATFALTRTEMTEGDAAFTHSGAGWGAVLGGLTELIIDGDAEGNASQGLGLGTAIGVVSAGSIAALADAPRPANVLMIDLSGALGALTGAAIGSPLLIAQEQRPSRDRLWLAAVGAGTLAGGVVGYLVTRQDSKGKGAGTDFKWSAYVAPHYDFQRPESAPIMTTGIHGTW